MNDLNETSKTLKYYSKEITVQHHPKYKREFELFRYTTSLRCKMTLFHLVGDWYWRPVQSETFFIPFELLDAFERGLFKNIEKTVTIERKNSVRVNQNKLGEYVLIEIGTDDDLLNAELYLSYKEANQLYLDLKEIFHEPCECEKEGMMLNELL